jgi:hypothetical protein
MRFFTIDRCAAQTRSAATSTVACADAGKGGCPWLAKARKRVFLAERKNQEARNLEAAAAERRPNLRVEEFRKSLCRGRLTGHPEVTLN